MWESVEKTSQGVKKVISETKSLSRCFWIKDTFRIKIKTKKKKKKNEQTHLPFLNVVDCTEPLEILNNLLYARYSVLIDIARRTYVRL